MAQYVILDTSWPSKLQETPLDRLKEQQYQGQLCSSLLVHIHNAETVIGPAPSLYRVSRAFLSL